MKHKKIATFRTRIIFDLITGRLTPGEIWSKKNYRFKFMMRTAFYYSPTCHMLERLSQRTDFNRLLNAQITLPSKPHRQYLILGLSASQRAAAIVDYYHYIDSLFAPRLIKAFTSPHEVMLLQLEGKDESRFTLSASCAHKAEREGETTLWLRDTNDRLLASLTFGVMQIKANWTLVIGGIQGPRRDVSHDVIKDATRACHGLFPKRILMEFIWLLVTRTSIKNLYGVSNDGHVFCALRYRWSKGHHFHASYDDFWKSLGGMNMNKRLWQLPIRPERKLLENIPSKKRAEYRRRFQLLDSMNEQINSFICSRRDLL
ncbi:VirK/YbjX family protein [Serratia fonticola]|uniref:VirK/YbjX family protein n=1 Tax=Serratia fonticola TaxID=47917 RepID=UPI00141557E2|nr:VirK/YbjX family protein [Serratia fonticola]QIP94564.1 virulence factor [Serratia fonticola]